MPETEDRVSVGVREGGLQVGVRLHVGTCEPVMVLEDDGPLSLTDRVLMVRDPRVPEGDMLLEGDCV